MTAGTRRDSGASREGGASVMCVSSSDPEGKGLPSPPPAAPRGGGEGPKSWMRTIPPAACPRGPPQARRLYREGTQPPAAARGLVSPPPGWDGTQRPSPGHGCGPREGWACRRGPPLIPSAGPGLWALWLLLPGATSGLEGRGALRSPGGGECRGRHCRALLSGGAPGDERGAGPPRPTVLPVPQTGGASVPPAACRSTPPVNPGAGGRGRGPSSVPAAHIPGWVPSGCPVSCRGSRASPQPLHRMAALPSVGDPPVSCGW